MALKSVDEYIVEMCGIILFENCYCHFLFSIIGYFDNDIS
jgi:hypothetical protein